MNYRRTFCFKRNHESGSLENPRESQHRDHRQTADEHISYDELHERFRRLSASLLKRASLDIIPTDFGFLANLCRPSCASESEAQMPLTV